MNDGNNLDHQNDSPIKIFIPTSRRPRPWPWMNAPSCGRDVAPHGHLLGTTGLPVGLHRCEIGMIYRGGMEDDEISLGSLENELYFRREKKGVFPLS